MAQLSLTNVNGQGWYVDETTGNLTPTSPSLSVSGAAITSTSDLATTGSMTVGTTLDVTGNVTAAGDVTLSTGNLALTLGNLEVAGGNLDVSGGDTTLHGLLEVSGLATLTGGFVLPSPKLAGATLTVKEESIVLSTSGATTDSTANLLTANSLILAVTARVTETIVTATDWKLGTATTDDRFTDANSTLTAGTTDISVNQWNQSKAAGYTPWQSAAAKVRITTTGTPSDGTIRVTVFALVFNAATS